MRALLSPALNATTWLTVIRLGLVVLIAPHLPRQATPMASGLRHA